MQHIPPRLEAIRFKPNSMICCFQFQEKKPLQGFTGLMDWRLLGRLSRLHISNLYAGNRGESLLVLPGNRLPASYLMLIGAGSEQNFTNATCKELIGEMITRARKLRVAHIVLSLPGRNENLISGEAATQLFFQHCPSFLANDKEFSFAIIDTSETHPIIVAEAERHRLRTDLTPMPISNKSSS